MNPSELYAIARNVMMEKTRPLLEQVRADMKKAAEEGCFRCEIELDGTIFDRRRTGDMEFIKSILEKDGFVVSLNNIGGPNYYTIRWEKNELALLRDEIAQLKAENAALRLLPGAPEYLATMEHYESLQKKE